MSKKNRQNLKKKLWKVFSEFIRIRDSQNGIGMCISCKKPVPYPNSTGAWHAGHYYPRSAKYSSLYFDEKNVNGQCSYCNTFLEGNKQGYRSGLIRKYGSEVLDYLDLGAYRPVRRETYEYEILIDIYKEKIKILKKEKGLV